MEQQSTPTSRSIAVLIIIITLIAVSALIPAKWIGGAKSIEQKPKLDLTRISLPQEVATDSNSDGAISWKEVMNSTLPNTPSTLEELKKIPVDQNEIDDLNDPNNLTSSFAKNVYLLAAYIEKNGITDQASKDEAVANLIQEEKSKIVPTVYSYKDIIVAKTETKESVRAYGNILASILDNVITQKNLVDDATSIDSFTKSKNVTDLEPIIKNKKRLDLIVQKLRAVSTPPSAVIFHIIALNRVTAYRDLVASLANANKDPLKATIVITDYPTTAVSTIRLFSQLSNYFITKNVVFSSKEKGSVFTVGYNPTN